MNTSTTQAITTYGCGVGRCRQPNWNASMLPSEFRAATGRPVPCPRCGRPARLLAVIHRPVLDFHNLFDCILRERDERGHVKVPVKLCRICGEQPATSPDFPGVCRWEVCERQAAADLYFERSR